MLNTVIFFPLTRRVYSYIASSASLVREVLGHLPSLSSVKGEYKKYTQEGAPSQHMPQRCRAVLSHIAAVTA